MRSNCAALVLSMVLLLVGTGTAQLRWVAKTPVASPNPRGGHVMAYDAGLGRAVMFGGDDFSLFNDTWTWDGLQWTRVGAGASLRPFSRRDHSIAYDAARGVIVMFGGDAGSPPPLGDTWTWNLASGWMKRTPVNSPPARAGHGMAFDAARRVVVLFGGRGTSGLLADTWTWDGTTWKNVTRPSGPNPPARGDIEHALAYDARRKVVVLFGGNGSTQPYADTWEWNGSAWAHRTTTTSPAARGHHAMSYDTVRRRVLLCCGGHGTIKRDDTWAWDGANWTQYTVPTPPQKCHSPGMVYDVSRDATVLFGGHGAFQNFAVTTEFGPSIIATPANPRRGTTVFFGVNAGPLDGGLVYQMATSGVGPPFLSFAGNRKLLLTPSPLLVYSVSGQLPGMFVGYTGFLNATGQAMPMFNIPNLAIFQGVNLASAFVTLDPTAPGGIKSLSDTFVITIQ